MSYTTVVNQHLEWFQELMEHQGLKVNANIEENRVLTSNPMLADMVVSNLLKNAIRHNVEGGTIEVQLDNHCLRVRNTGKVIDFDPSTLFERFQKGDASAEGTGLGLAIVKETVEAHGWQVQYLHNKGLHSIQINFGNPAA